MVNEKDNDEMYRPIDGNEIKRRGMAKGSDYITAPIRHSNNSDRTRGNAYPFIFRKSGRFGTVHGNGKQSNSVNGYPKSNVFTEMGSSNDAYLNGSWVAIYEMIEKEAQRRVEKILKEKLGV